MLISGGCYPPSFLGSNVGKESALGSDELLNGRHKFCPWVGSANKPVVNGLPADSQLVSYFCHRHVMRDTDAPQSDAEELPTGLLVELYQLGVIPVAHISRHRPIRQSHLKGPQWVLEGQLRASSRA